MVLNMSTLNMNYDKMNSILCIYYFLGFGCYLFFVFDRWHSMVMLYMWIVFRYFFCEKILNL